MLYNQDNARSSLDSAQRREALGPYSERLQNLRNLWDSRTSSDMEAKDAYRYYHDTLKTLAHHYGEPLDRVIAAFAALSPNNLENTNYIALEASIVNHQAGGTLLKVPAYGKNKVKALRILRGQPIEQVLKGQKVVSFYHNILNPSDPRYVTVDGHMYNAWCNQVRRLNSKALNVTTADYRLITEHIRCLAHSLSLVPSSLQAILWVIWKRKQQISYTPQRRLPFQFRTLYPTGKSAQLQLFAGVDRLRSVAS